MNARSQPVGEQVRSVRETSTGWHIQRLAGQLDRGMNAALEPHGLTVQSFAIVMTLLEHDGLSQKEIGQRFSAPAYAISRAIDGLERDGFLERRIDPSSRRANTVHATTKAKDLAPRLFAIISDVNARLLDHLDQAEQAQLKALLARVLANNALNAGKSV